VEIRIHPMIYKDQNIYSVYSLCSNIPPEELTASLTSAYTVSVLVAEVVASLGIAVPFLATCENPALVAAPASAYDLSTAVT